MSEYLCPAFCWWDIPAFLLRVMALLIFGVQHRNLKKKEKDLEDQISTLYVDDMIR